MKTALEWFEQLPEPIRSLAIENFNNDPAYASEQLFKNLPDSLDGGFNWRINGQRYSYWNDIHVRALRGEFDQPNLHGWIPVSERLPTAKDADENENVLALRGSDKIVCFWAGVNENDFQFWQPLPKLPEVKDGK